jgi:hypothetical protein
MNHLLHYVVSVMKLVRALLHVLGPVVGHDSATTGRQVCQRLCAECPLNEKESGIMAYHVIKDALE